MITREINDKLIFAQRNEISEYYTYSWLAKRTKDENNRKVLENIANEELRHHKVLQSITKKEVKPRWFWIYRYRLIARIFGLSFGLRLMERGEKIAEKFYDELKKEVSEVADLFMDEQKHESELLSLIKEERIEYASSLVLGLNDALVELTGALAGYTLALQNSRLIAMAGFITGIAASMSMAVSAYLSAREEADINISKNPIKSAVYTGVAYIITVLILISPYLILDNIYTSVTIMMAMSILIILGYNFYITTAKNLKLWKRFIEMALISLTVAFISFMVGIFAKSIFGVEI